MWAAGASWVTVASWGYHLPCLYLDAQDIRNAHTEEDAQQVSSSSSLSVEGVAARAKQNRRIAVHQLPHRALK